MNPGICGSLAPEFYDIFLIGCQFTGDPCIIMTICNTIIRVQIILYGLICMAHHSRNLFYWIPIPRQLSGFVNFLLLLL